MSHMSLSRFSLIPSAGDRGQIISRVGSASSISAFEEIHARVTRYLASEGASPELARILQDGSVPWLGPILIPTRFVDLLVGPEPSSQYPEDPTVWLSRVHRLMEVLRSDELLPPILVKYDGERFVVRDGNHRTAAAVGLASPRIVALIWANRRSRLQAAEECLSHPQL